MGKCSIDQMIAKKRKEKGVTQEVLASVMGVSKASVSKWETGQSYPDIALLPRLASYFHISIDELMGYVPQITEEEIHELLAELSEEFSKEHEAQVLEECRKVLHQYPSCYPLLLQMAFFYVNHCSILEEGREGLIREARGLCIRCRQECDDLFIRKQAVGLEAACELLLNQPSKVLELLGEDAAVLSEDESLISLAYQNLGQQGKARNVMQVSIYQHMNAVVNCMISYLYLNGERPQVFEDTWTRLKQLMEVFHLDQLKPAAVLQAYMIAASVCSRNGDHKRVIELLRYYADLSLSGMDVTHLKGDEFFDEVEEWMADKHMDCQSMRSRRTIQKELVTGMLHEPAFGSIKEEPEFQEIVKRLNQ